tara:strand:+ start:8625 stop:9476 length:852 start_codon:yes stop_codon:yes gene_type:complete
VDNFSKVDRNNTGFSDRLMLILAMFAENEGTLGVSEIADALDIPRSSVHRILSPLVAHGFVERTAQRRYRIGTEMFRIAARIESRFEILQVAKPMMESITAECGETTVLGLLSRARTRFILAHKVDPQLPLRFRLELLTNQDLIWGSIGRAILAWLPPLEIRRALAEAGPSMVTGAAAPTWSELLKENEEVRRRGVAISHGHRAGPDVIGLSSAFLDAHGHARGAIGVIAPSARMTPDKQARVTKLLYSHASELSYQLGYLPRSRPMMPGCFDSLSFAEHHPK